MNELLSTEDLDLTPLPNKRGFSNPQYPNRKLCEIIGGEWKAGKKQMCTVEDPNNLDASLILALNEISYHQRFKPNQRKFVDRRGELENANLKGKSDYYALIDPFAGGRYKPYAAPDVSRFKNLKVSKEIADAFIQYKGSSGLVNLKQSQVPISSSAIQTTYFSDHGINKRKGTGILERYQKKFPGLFDNYSNY
mgnify:CR=1 FL=1